MNRGRICLAILIGMVFTACVYVKKDCEDPSYQLISVKDSLVDIDYPIKNCVVEGVEVKKYNDNKKMILTQYSEGQINGVRLSMDSAAGTIVYEYYKMNNLVCSKTYVVEKSDSGSCCK